MGRCSFVLKNLGIIELVQSVVSQAAISICPDFNDVMGATVPDGSNRAAIVVKL